MRLRTHVRLCSTDEQGLANADDRLPPASLGPVEGGDGVVEGRDVADVRPQSSVTHPLDDLTQLGAIGHENKVDRQAVGRSLTTALTATALLAKIWLAKDRPLSTCATGRNGSLADL